MKRKKKLSEDKLAETIMELHRESADMLCRVSRLEEKWSRPLLPYGSSRFVARVVLFVVASGCVAAAVVELLK